MSICHTDPDRLANPEISSTDNPHYSFTARILRNPLVYYIAPTIHGHRGVSDTYSASSSLLTNKDTTSRVRGVIGIWGHSGAF